MTTTTATLQLTLEGEVHYNAKCKYCGKGFNKTANKQLYCSDECRHNARLEQKAEYQRKRRMLVKRGVLIVTDKEKGCTTYNSNYLSEHPHADFKREKRAIEREMKRLGLK